MGAVLPFVTFAASLALLIGSTHFFLKSVRHIGITLGVRPFILGSLIVAFGTTSPELMIALFAVLNGSTSVPIAQAAGSNIANILLVLGVASLFIRRATSEVAKKTGSSIDLTFLIASTLLFVFVVLDGSVYLYEGILLLLAFGVYVCRILFSKSNNLSYPMTPQRQIGTVSQVPHAVVIFLVTTGSIAVASHVVVSSLRDIAQVLQVPEGVIAATALAIGTSLPELVVAIQATLRGEIELVYSSIVGANVFNLLVVTGIPSLITTLSIDMTGFSLPLIALVAALFLFVVSSLSRRIRFWQGVIYILFYLLLVIQIGSTLVI